MNDLLHRVELHTVEQGRDVMLRNFLPWCGEQLTHGRELVIEAKLLDDDVTKRQRNYFHDVVLKEIAQFAPGEKHHWKVWKEYFREEFIGYRYVTNINPITGKKRRRKVRISSEELGVRGYAQHIEKVIAFASTELGLTISEPLPPELRPGRHRARPRERIDPDTGEILQEKECTT